MSCRSPSLLIGLLLLASPADARDLYLVVAGNNVGVAGDQPLRYAERDAASFAQVMRQLGGARPDSTTLVVGESAETLRRSIVTANSRIRQADASRRQGAVLVVYYSGHADASGLHLAGSTLAYDELKGLVRGSPAAVRLLIIDGCRSGTATRVKGLLKPKETVVISVDDKLGVEGTAIITSSAAGEDSHESDRLRASYFTHHLVGGLRGAADDDKSGVVTLDEAYAYAYQQTLTSSGRTRNLQHPTYDYDIRGKGALILTRLTAKSKHLGRLRLPAKGLYLIREDDEAGPLFGEVRVGAQGATLVLPANRYLIERRDPRAYHQFPVAIAGGSEVTLPSQPRRTLDYARLLRKGGGEPRAVHGLELLGAARGEILDGVGVTPQLGLGYRVDFEQLSLGVRARWSIGSADALHATMLQHQEVGLGVVLERYFDLSWLSISVGLGVEGVLHFQRFDSQATAPNRTAWGLGLSILLALERELGGGFSLRIEGGPRTDLFQRTTTLAGAPTGSELATPLTFWVGGGLIWRL